ncbi:MAG: glycosyltransferase family 4 protein [Verrucomicrobiota bacterium]
MSNGKLTIGFVRRGYSPSGGAESYLKRLARGISDLGHDAELITTTDWPEKEWPFGPIARLEGRSIIAFADAAEKVRMQDGCDVLMSLERIWRCDIYRAGDGVHRAWLERREGMAGPFANFWHRFNRKHHDILRLEKSLLAERGAGRVIANSQMVKNEIVDFYGYPADRIDIVRNGVPLEQFRFDPAVRERSRTDLKLRPDEITLLFVGSGWERKGLRFAIAAMRKRENPNLRMLVVGRGNERKHKSPGVEFFGELTDLQRVYAAADIFILPTIYDPFSNGCLEALASGLPVITTRANGFSEIMDDHVHGSIVDLPSNIEALSDAILFWADPSKRAAARLATVERASHFDISQNVEQTLGILMACAKRGEP